MYTLIRSKWPKKLQEVHNFIITLGKLVLYCLIKNKKVARTDPD